MRKTSQKYHVILKINKKPLTEPFQTRLRTKKNYKKYKNFHDLSLRMEIHHLIELLDNLVNIIRLR